MTIHQFGNEVLDVLRRHLGPGNVNFRGSFASGKVDDYSDVDLEARVHVELTQGFFDSLSACLKKHFGAFTVRFDPQQKGDRMAQNIMVNLHEYPLFWRIDSISSRTKTLLRNGLHRSRTGLSPRPRSGTLYGR